MESDKAILDSTEEKVSLIKQEVNALQLSVKSQQMQWYKSPAIMISILALLFSFGTTYASFKRIEAQEIQNSRVELRGLLQRLAYLTRDNFEITRKYPNDPTAALTVSGYIGQEMTLLSRQAAELLRRIPKDYISSTEYWSIATGLMSAYDNQGAKEFLGYAINSARDFVDKISALRANANLMFTMGDPKNGRIEYQKALNIFAEFPGYDATTVASTHIQTEISWAYSESASNFNDLVNQHLVNAESYLREMTPGSRKNDMAGQINSAQVQLGYARQMRPLVQEPVKAPTHAIAVTPKPVVRPRNERKAQPPKRKPPKSTRSTSGRRNRR